MVGGGGVGVGVIDEEEYRLGEDVTQIVEKTILEIPKLDIVGAIGTVVLGFNSCIQAI